MKPSKELVPLYRGDDGSSAPRRAERKAPLRSATGRIVRSGNAAIGEGTTASSSQNLCGAVLARSMTMLVCAAIAACAAAEEPVGASIAEPSSAVAFAVAPLNGTYLGASWGACSAGRRFTGYAPTNAGAKVPLFIYLVGTLDSYQSPVALAILREVAARGAVAVSVEYSNLIPNCTTLSENSRCIFDPQESSSVVAKLCARPDVDCNLGIVTAGHSQGAGTSALAKNWNTRVRAWWGLGVTSDTLPPQGGAGNQDGLSSPTDRTSDCLLKASLAIPANRMRANNGQNDMCFPTSVQPCQGFGSQPEVQRITGTSCAPSTMNCLNSDGSGWYVVANGAVQDGDADHGYFANGAVADLGFAPPSTAPWSVATNAAWMLSWTRGPSVPQRISCGATGIVKGPFSKDDKYVPSTTTSTFTTTNPIDVTAANAAPMAVYQTQRLETWWRTLTYRLDGLAPNTSYLVRLHFAELWFARAGARKFHVQLQGIRRETDLDIFAQAGGAFKALVKQYAVTSDASGVISVELPTGSADNPILNGLEVL